MCNAIRAAGLWIAALDDMQIRALLMCPIWLGITAWCWGSEIRHQHQLIMARETNEEDMNGEEVK